MQDVGALVVDLTIILAAGFFSAAVCRRIGVSTIVGYLVVGAVLGHGGLKWITHEQREIEYLAEAGALLLLFSVGIEFSLSELVRLSRYFFVGGAVQLSLTAVPVALACGLAGVDWKPSLLIGAAVGLSSTVLVFRALAEFGENSSPRGRRAIGILLFQDVALVPLMLLIPLLTGGGGRLDAVAVLFLIGNGVLFVASVLAVRYAVRRWLVPLLSRLRSTESVVLFVLALLGGAGLGAHAGGLTASLGAFAAGLTLSDNRLTAQIDALVLPYRESFAAVFFISVGALLQPAAFFREPVLLMTALAAVLMLKTTTAAVALRLTGLGWKAAAGMGLGLAQLGEFSILLLSAGLKAEVIGPETYNRMLFIALASFILTPQLLRLGLRRFAGGMAADGEELPTGPLPAVNEGAIVAGAGPVGRHVASQLELSGVDVCLVDLSPVNLYAFAQQGFRTVAGDARDARVLQRAGAPSCRLAVVSVPEDRVAQQITHAIRKMNRLCIILVRCRYQASLSSIRAAGADVVVSEEAEVSTALRRLVERMRTGSPDRAEQRR